VTGVVLQEAAPISSRTSVGDVVPSSAGSATIVHVEDDAVLMAAVGLQAGKIGASAVLDGEGA
jgi:hypothetical protein